MMSRILWHFFYATTLAVVLSIPVIGILLMIEVYFR